MAQVAAIWRHPIKSHGRESIASVVLRQGEAMPGDRRWAVVHDMAKDDPDGQRWVSYQNFMIGTRTPGLAGLWAKLHADDRTMTLRHRDLGEMTFEPDNSADTARFLSWIEPLCPENRSRPVRFARIDQRGWTDTEFPSVSLMNIASNRAVEDQLGQPLEMERWRGNFWIDGIEAWAETGWIGKRLRLGEAVLDVIEPVERCLHTAANPVTGQRDADTLGALERGWGHRDFGIYAEVVSGGTVRVGDKIEVL